MTHTEGMDPDEFRSALRGAMATVDAPRPMDANAMVATARQARQRRRRALAGGASAVAVTAVVVGVAVTVGNSPSAPSLGIGAPGATSGSPATTTGGASASDTEPTWPSGQTDATASSGPRFERGQALLDTLTSMAPDGYDTGDVTIPGYSGTVRGHQAQVSLGEGTGQPDGWVYDAQQPLSKGAATGIAMVEVSTPGVLAKSDPCTVARSFWGMGGQCHVQRVNDVEVGVVTASTDRRFDQWAGYQYPDGTAVFVAQAKGIRDDNGPKLDKDPYTLQELAAMAVRPEFHLT